MSSKSEIKILKLSTGEEVLAKVEDVGDLYILTDSRTLAYSPDGKAGMIPLIQMAPDRPVRLYKSAIIAEVHPIDADMERKYLSDTSGIIL